MNRDNNVEIWHAYAHTSDHYRVCNLRESDKTFLVRIHCGEAIIEDGNAHVRTDVRAARIRVIAKRAHRRPDRTATMESRNGDEAPTE